MGELYLTAGGPARWSKRTRPSRRKPGAYLGQVYVGTDAADVLRRPAGTGFLIKRTRADAKRPFASPRWRCPKMEFMLCMTRYSAEIARQARLDRKRKM